MAKTTNNGRGRARPGGPVFVKEVVACRKFMAKPSLDWRMDSRPYASPD